MWLVFTFESAVHFVLTSELVAWMKSCNEKRGYMLAAERGERRGPCSFRHELL